MHQPAAPPGLRAGRAALEVAAPDLTVHPWSAVSIREDFDSFQLALDFKMMRVPLHPDSFSLEERPGFLRLKCRESIGSRNIRAFIARRQQAFRYRAATCMEFDPSHFKHSAGLICLYDQENLYYLEIGFKEGMGR